MILPAKHIPLERSISGLGAEILVVLDTSQSVSELWAKVRADHDQRDRPITFDWFVAALSWLYSISAIEFDNGLLSRSGS